MRRWACSPAAELSVASPLRAQGAPLRVTTEAAAPGAAARHSTVSARGAKRAAGPAMVVGGGGGGSDLTDCSLVEICGAA